MVRIRNVPGDIGGRKGDWDRKARDNPVNKRIYDLFGLDSSGFCSRLADIYRYQADRLDGRSKRIKTKQDLLSPTEFEEIVRFQPYLTEEFFNIHVLPYSNNLGDWTPRLQIPYYYRAEDLDWNDPKNSLIPDTGSEIISSTSTDDDQNQRILDDFEETSTIVVPRASHESTEQPGDQPDIAISTTGQFIEAPMEQDIAQNEAIIAIPESTVQNPNIDSSQKRQMKHIPPISNKGNRNKPYVIPKIPPIIMDSNYFKSYFNSLALPGQLPDLDTCKRRDFQAWLRVASKHKQVDQTIVEKCIGYIHDRRSKEESSNASQYSNPSIVEKSGLNQGQPSKENASKTICTPIATKTTTNEKNIGESSRSTGNDIGYIISFLSSIYPLPSDLLDGSPESNVKLRAIFELVRRTEAKTRKSFLNKK